MERKIDDIFTFKGNQFKVIEGICIDCYFYNKSCFERSVRDIIGKCYADISRKDDACFKLVEE